MEANIVRAKPSALVERGLQAAFDADIILSLVANETRIARNAEVGEGRAEEHDEKRRG
jgi:hypothetical protein